MHYPLSIWPMPTSFWIFVHGHIRRGQFFKFLDQMSVTWVMGLSTLAFSRFWLPCVHTCRYTCENNVEHTLDPHGQLLFSYPSPNYVVLKRNYALAHVYTCCAHVYACYPHIYACCVNVGACRMLRFLLVHPWYLFYNRTNFRKDLPTFDWDMMGYKLHAPCARECLCAWMPANNFSQLRRLIFPFAEVFVKIWLHLAEILRC